MHDISSLERLGVPGVVVATDGFVSAVEVQQDALGCRLRTVYVPHPVSALTSAELARLAADTVAAIVEALVAPS